MKTQIKIITLFLLVISNSTFGQKKRGFINITELNYSNGIVCNNDEISFGLRTTNGYQFNKNISLGISTGVDFYRETSFIPISFDFRGSFLNGKTTPVFNANIGYSFALDGDAYYGMIKLKGGLMLNPQIGIKTYISKKVAYLFNLGFKWQNQTSSYMPNMPFDNLTLSRELNLQFITLNTGLSF